MKNKTTVSRYGEAAPFIKKWKAERCGYYLPWAKAQKNISQRCRSRATNKSQYYFGRGIKCLVSGVDLKELFFRDKAWKMKIPSVDRINPDGDYVKENLRWIEFSKNRSERLFSNPCRAQGYVKLMSLISAEMEALRWPIYIRRAFFRKALTESRSWK
jgi:hypothetical protein